MGRLTKPRALGSSLSSCRGKLQPPPPKFSGALRLQSRLQFYLPNNTAEGDNGNKGGRGRGRTALLPTLSSSLISSRKLLLRGRYIIRFAFACAHLLGCSVVKPGSRGINELGSSIPLMPAKSRRRSAMGSPTARQQPARLFSRMAPAFFARLYSSSFVQFPRRISL